MNGLIVRELIPKEFTEAINVSLESFGVSAFESIESNEELWLKLYNNSIVKFIVAEVNGKLIGVAGLFLFDQVATVGNMCVLQKYRSKGIGTAIFKEIMDKAKNLGYESIELYASEYGEPLYKKFDFQGEYHVNKYQLIVNKNQLELNSTKTEIIKKLPAWLIHLDKKCFGSDRTKFLRIKMELGGKIIILGEKGYGLYSNGRIGPLITKDVETAKAIIEKSILLGANHLITSKSKNLSKILSKDIKLNSGDNKPNLKMYYGRKKSQELKYLYSLSSFAKG